MKHLVAIKSYFSGSIAEALQFRTLSHCTPELAPHFFLDRFRNQTPKPNSAIGSRPPLGNKKLFWKTGGSS